MTKFTRLPVVLLLVALPGCAARQTWTGLVADTSCRGSHPFDEHGAQMSDKACVLECINQGAKFALVTDSGTMYAIQNQDNAALTEFAGAKVDVTGRLDHDALVVEKIELANRK